MLYSPKGNGKEKNVQPVRFHEVEPPNHLSGVVHRFLELKTVAPLPEDYRFHALPDACTYIIFDQLDGKVAGITKLRATSEELNLGKSFHYVNIRFLPGVWQGSRDEFAYGMVDTHYSGRLSLIDINRRLVGLDFASQQLILSTFVEQLINERLVAPNSITEKIFANIDDIRTVADMAAIAGVSPRQLQRILIHTTGFSPHDFLKVMRLQQSLSGNSYLSSYTDQSHFIHSFRKATGYTPAKYAEKFDV